MADLNILFPTDKYFNKYDNYKAKIEKVNYGEVYLNIWVWNMQSLNKIYKRRQAKIDFIKNTLNNNKVDIVYLVDVNNFRESIVLNGFKKYDDGRNLLFVQIDINDDFSIDKKNYLIFNNNIKLAFSYLTPNSQNFNQAITLKKLFDKKFAIFGDFNIQSNKNFFDNWLNEFYGEDTMRTGIIGCRPKKFFILDAPSDHYSILFIVKKKIHFSFPLRIKEISVEYGKSNVKKILNGIDADFRPKIEFKQTKLRYNDGENIIDRMLSDYIENKVEKVYKKYNYLWKFAKREPFLGTKVPNNIVDTFAVHLKANDKKDYKDVPLGTNSISKINLLSKVKQTKSKALTNEYISLCSVTKAIDEYFSKEIDVKKKNGQPYNWDYKVLNNVLSLINKHKCFLVANSFFLVKNSKLEDFSDVRMIVIIPTLVKVFETLIYNEVVDYLSEVIGSKGKYQYGGVKGGSTYEAIYALRNNYIEVDGKGILCCDMSKGFDCVNLTKLEQMIKEVNNERIRWFLGIWQIVISNLDIKMNERVVCRTRGIPMGLSLSPVIFTFYVHNVLKNFDVTKFIMYMDDLCVILSKSLSDEDAFAFVNKVIDALGLYDLIINKKKTMLLTTSSTLENNFSSSFPIVTEDKYLGVELGLNGDGFLVADDRFYNLKSSRVKAFPNFNIFGIRRILFITALDAKNRYRFMCWSTNSKLIRASIFKNNWFFFKSNNNKFSYIQMIFSLFNVFRFFIDSFEVDKLIIDYEKGISPSALNLAVIDKLLTGIEQIDSSIKKIKCDFSFIDHSNKLLQGKKFCDNLFFQIQENMLLEYVAERKNKGIIAYYNINNFARTKLFRNFQILQNLAFIHQINERNKQLLIFDVLQVLAKSLDKCIVASNNSYKIVSLINLDNFVFEDLSVPKNLEDFDVWEGFVKLASAKLWSFLDKLIFLDQLSTSVYKNNDAKIIFKEIFKILTVLETMCTNKNLNNIALDVLEIIFKVKRVSLDPLADKFFEAVNTHDEIQVFDHDILNI